MTTAEDTEPEVTDEYENVGEWVEHWLIPALELDGGKWIGGGHGRVLCPEWYRHRMVTLRLNAAWREWEKANREDTMSAWWVYHYDAHVRVIFDGESGPMYLCTVEKHRENNNPLKPHRVPAGWFDKQGGGGPDFRVLQLSVEK